MNKAEARNLLKKYLDGTCTPEEKGLLESWYLRHEHKDIAELTDEKTERSLEKVRASLRGTASYGNPVAAAAGLRHLPVWRAAAVIAVLLAAGLGWYLYPGVRETTTASQTAETTDYMQPGGNKALLTLADGRKISLTDAADGTLTSQAGVTLTKTEDGQLVYEAAKETDEAKTKHDRLATADPEKIPWNTVETPRGGQYQLILPDGSHVWLNAGSSLKYPASFAGLNERRVILEGEAYFEVTTDPSKPFRVTGSRQEVEVLGTSFNIYSYPEEAVVRTTLLEGSLRVRSEPEKGARNLQERLLRPGDQSSLSASGLEVKQIDVEGAVAWKNGLFMFNNERLDQIMLMIARWYDIEVEFAHADMKDDRFNGSVSRFSHATQVLKKLELTGGVQFSVEGRKVIVSRPSAVHRPVLSPE